MALERREIEDLTTAMAELARRRREDPLSLYPLHEKQKAFVHSVLTRKHKENWFIAANRAGKSDAGAYCGASLARFGIETGKIQPGNVQVNDRATSGWVSALDFPTSRDVVQPKYFDNGFVPPGQRHPPFIPKHEIAEWRDHDQILRLKNGSLIGFKSAESGRRKYQGAEKDWMHMDEEHPWEIYEESVIRIGNRPLNFFCTATILPPEGANSTVSWVFGKIIQPWQSGTLPHVGCYAASIYDNPGIPREEIARLEAIYPPLSLARRIRLGGEWLPGIGGSRAYISFDRQLHVRPQPEISRMRPICWMWDFNVEPMVSLIGQVDMERGAEIYRIFKEIVLDEANIEEMCQIFADHFPRHRGEVWIYGDASGNKRGGQHGKTDYYVIQQEMRRLRIPIRLKVPSDNPKIGDRINAVNRLCRDESGLVRLLVDPSCADLIADLEQVLRDNRGGIHKVRNRKDPYFRRTHTSDALGYWLAFEEPVTPPSEYSRRQINLNTPRYAFGNRHG